jgi:hypothetical protein
VPARSHFENVMSQETSTASAEVLDASRLKYYRHPSPNSNTYYGAYGPNRLRVKRGDLWGEFDRDGNWLAGEIRFADPTFCRWVTGEHIYNAQLKATKCETFVPTRLAMQEADKST